MQTSVMTSADASPVLRQRFDAGADRHAGRLLRLLLAQDGSTTRLCEAIAGGPVQLQVLRQHVTRDVPAVVRAALGGTEFIERCTCLTAHGQVMMDNLTYIALEGLAADVRRDLEAGAMPIGHLLQRLWVRRETLPDAADLLQRLWQQVGMADAPSSRVYRIVTPEGPRMVIAETYRSGMRWAMD
jgi:chorismate-pyruvate lyase